MPLHLKACKGDLLLITEPALLKRCDWQLHAINCTALLDRTRACGSSCEACSEWKDLIFLMLNKEKLQDRVVLAKWSEKVSWPSITTPRFLAVFEGVMVDEPNWKVKLWWKDGFDETTSSSVLARFSWRWWSFIQLEMSIRQAEMRAATVRSSGWMRGSVECHQHSSDMKSHVSEWQNLVKPCRQKREVVQALSPVAPL